MIGDGVCVCVVGVVVVGVEDVSKVVVVVVDAVLVVFSIAEYTIQKHKKYNKQYAVNIRMTTYYMKK